MNHYLLAAIFFLTAISVSAQTIIKETQVNDDTTVSSNTVTNPKQDPRATPTPDASTTSSDTYVRPDATKRFNRAVKGIVGPSALAKTVLSAGWSTWRNSPEEWGDKWEGFGRRVASSFGKGVIKQSTIYVMDEAFQVDSHYYKSKKKDLKSKMGNALLSTVTARNKNGKRVFGAPRIVGTYASSVIAAEAWYPSRFNYKNGLRSGTISMGTAALFNVVKELFFNK